MDWKKRYRIPKIGSKVRFLKVNGIDVGFKIGKIYTLVVNYSKTDQCGKLWTIKGCPGRGMGEKEFEVVR